MRRSEKKEGNMHLMVCRGKASNDEWGKKKGNMYNWTK
jgi:hypothetical protein